MENKLNLPIFYVGQKVAYVGDKKRSDFNYPSKDEVVTISGMEKNPRTGNLHYTLKEYPLCKEGQKQCFLPSYLKPLEEINPPLMTFQKIVEKEKEEILINN